MCNFGENKYLNCDGDCGECEFYDEAAIEEMVEEEEREDLQKQWESATRIYAPDDIEELKKSMEVNLIAGQLMCGSMSTKRRTLDQFQRLFILCRSEMEGWLAYAESLERYPIMLLCRAAEIKKDLQDKAGLSGQEAARIALIMAEQTEPKFLFYEPEEPGEPWYKGRKEGER